MAMKELGEYRKEIDTLDDQIINLLARRFEIVRAVGRLKARNNIPVVQSARVVEVINRAAALAARQNLDPDLVRHLYQIMIDHAHTLENNLSDESNP